MPFVRVVPFISLLMFTTVACDEDSGSGAASDGGAGGMPGSGGAMGAGGSDDQGDECYEGSEGCPCTVGGACVLGLTCSEGLCVEQGRGGGTGGVLGTGGVVGGTGGMVGPELGYDDTSAFEPAVPFVYDGPLEEHGLEIVAHTVQEDVFGDNEWMVAIKNVSADIKLCAPAFDFDFLDAGGQVLATADLVIPAMPLVRGVSGTGSLTQCLVPGEIGMAHEKYALKDVDVSAIASVSWSVSAINLVDAVASQDLLVTDVAVIQDEFDSHIFSGNLLNNSGGLLRYPSVDIFGVNSVGRPIAYGSDIEDTTIASGGVWSFTTYQGFTHTVTQWVAYPDGNDN